MRFGAQVRKTKYLKWCEALSSVFSSSGGPSGSNSRFVKNLYFRKLDLEISFHIPRPVGTRLFGILVGAMSFTGVVLNFKVESKSRETIENSNLQDVVKSRISRF